MAAPNLVNVTSIYGKTVGLALGTNTATVSLTCPSNKVLKVNSIIVGNKVSVAANVTVYYYDSTSISTGRALAHTVSVPANASLVVLSRDTAIYLEEGEKISAGASATNSLDITISYEEMDDA